MSHVIETVVYSFDELNDKAKEKAREWYREGGYDYDWWLNTYDDAKTCAAILGIEIDNIYFSGFSSQGDGACFEGRYTYRKGAANDIREHAPTELCLHQIADVLQEIQRVHFYKLEARVKQSGHYSHEHCTEIEVFDADGDYAGATAHVQIADQLRKFMKWIYRQLEAEYDYLNTDEYVDETIKANEYTFTESGRRFG